MATHQRLNLEEKCPSFVRQYAVRTGEEACLASWRRGRFEGSWLEGHLYILAASLGNSLKYFIKPIEENVELYVFCHERAYDQS